NRCETGDRIILTKPLGVGLITAFKDESVMSKEGYEQAVSSMVTLNKYSFDIAKKYRIHSSTDVTGFGFLGHLNEMVTSKYSIRVDAEKVLYIEDAKKIAAKGLATDGGDTNREFLQNKLSFVGVPEWLVTILFDPQTSGGLMFSVHKDDADALLEELGTLEQQSCMVGEVIARAEHNLIVQGG
ncbi:MAG: selenide, water dikinase SelD, partial [Oscillospiraceae bacterium]|nr:selenide, water dikinase SelD [Oscillospiraceae bacterium]